MLVFRTTSGDYRMPRALLTSPEGSRLNASVVAPRHGIVRGTHAQNFCSWNAAWNGYKCSKLGKKGRHLTFCLSENCSKGENVKLNAIFYFYRLRRLPHVHNRELGR